MSTFRTRVHVHLWPTKDVSLTSAVPATVFKGEEIDLEGKVVLTKDAKEVDITFWNLGSLEALGRVFQRDFLLAVDVRRIDLDGSSAADAPLHRTVLARVKDAGMGDMAEGTDVPYRVRAIPIAETLREIAVRANFLAAGGPYRLRHVVEELLRLAGVGAVQVDLPDTAILAAFTVDDTVWNAIKRAAAKAGVPVAIWMTGGMVRVSDRFIGLAVLGDGFILGAGRAEASSVQSVQPIVPEELQVTGEAYDLSEQYAAGDEETQVALDEAPANAAYWLEVPLMPEASEGGMVAVKNGSALARMGIFRTEVQAFNVIGLEHSFSTLQNASEMDSTKLHVGIRVEPEEEAP